MLRNIAGWEEKLGNDNIMVRINLGSFKFANNLPDRFSGGNSFRLKDNINFRVKQTSSGEMMISVVAYGNSFQVLFLLKMLEKYFSGLVLGVCVTVTSDEEK